MIADVAVPLLFTVVLVAVLIMVYLMARPRKSRQIDGVMEIKEQEDGKLLYVLDLHADPFELRDRDTITFRVDRDKASAN